MFSTAICFLANQQNLPKQLSAGVVMSKNSINKLEKFFNDAQQKLKQDNLDGYYDENKRWENTACQILNIAYGWNLQNLNVTHSPNYPAIDLGDENLKIGVQVSTLSDVPKINNTLSKLNNEVNGIQIKSKYNNIYMFIPGYASTDYNGKIFKIPQNVNFNQSHIIDFSVFKSKFCELDEILQKQILEVLEKALYIRPKYELNAPLIEHCDFIQNSRHIEMDLLDEKFEHSKTVFLWGLGGIGKTELAIAWGKEKIAQGERVYFVHYKGSIIDTVLNMEFSDFNYSNSAMYTSYKEQRYAKFKEKLNILRNYYSGSIIIIDNFDKEDPYVTWADMLNQEGYSDLIKLNIKLLFTTRFEVAISAIKVQELTLQELFLLFKQNAKEVLPEEQYPQAINLIELVDRHTLTVVLMSRSLYYSFGEITLESLISAFKDSTLNSRPLPSITASHNSDLSDFEWHELRILGHLRKLFEISNLNMIQQNIMCHAILLPENGLDIRRFRNCHTDAENEVLTQSLIKRNWLQTDQAHTRISMHSVIRQVCHEELTPTDENCSFFLHSLIATMQPDENQYILKPVYDTIIQAADTLDDYSGEWHHLSGKYYRLIGYYQLAKKYLDIAFNHATHRVPDNPEILAKIIDETILNCVRLRNFKEAVSHTQECRCLIQNISNTDLCSKIFHDLATAYGFLAEKEHDRSLFDKALEYFNLARNYILKSDSKDRQYYIASNTHSIGNIYSNIGKTFRGPEQQNNYDSALHYHLEALKIRLNIPDFDYINLARSYNAIGNDYANKKNDEEALKYRKKALEYFEKSLLSTHPDIAKQHSNIAHSYQQLNNYQNAIDHYKKSESIYRKNLPQELHSLTRCQYHLLQIYWEKSKEKQLEDLRYAKEFGEEAYKNAQALNNNKLSADILKLLAKVYENLGDRKKQQDVLILRMGLIESSKDISMQEKIKGLKNLASVARKNQNLTLSQQIYEKLYEYELLYTPENYTQIIDTLFRLGLVYQQLNLYNDSLSFLNQAKELYLKNHSPEQIDLKELNKIQKTIKMVTGSIKKHQS